MKTNSLLCRPALAWFIALVLLISAPLASAYVPQRAQERSAERAYAAPLKGLHWRSIGPYRGGRVTAAAGVTSQPNVYYFGATGGGVWKTTDGGVNWTPVSDEYFKTGSVG